MRGLFARRYSNRYDAETTENWMREIVLKSMMTFHAVRTDDALCISLLTSYPWLPADKEVYVTVLCADFGKIWQTVPLLRASIDWARRRGALRWRMQSDTENDIGPLLRRVGAKQGHPRFEVNF
jgi:hypothetical protein